MQTGDGRERERSELRSRVWLVLAQVLVVLAAVLLLWNALDIVLLIFGGILLAVLLSELAEWMGRYLSAPYRLRVVVVSIVLLALAVLVGWWLGPRIAEQADRLVEQLPTSIEELRNRLGGTGWGDLIASSLPDPQAEGEGPDMVGRVFDFFRITIGVLMSAFVVAFLGIYFALAPAAYRKAVLRLLPPAHREGPGRALVAIGSALRSWILGRVGAMLVVTVLTALGLVILGMPLVLSLALLAGLLNFVPYVGPIAAAVPAILVALGESPGLALWVAVVYLAVQTFETFVATPFIQKKAVSIPPALLVISQILMGLAAGVLGVLLATPVAVSVVVLIQMLYVDDTLGEDVEVLGS